MEKNKVVYYKNELEDEFSKVKIQPIIIDENYRYSKNPLWDFCSIIFQNLISMPIKILYAKIKFRVKYIGREKFKKYKNTGYFIYGNHTQAFADTFLPSIANYPKRNFLIVNPENISMKGLKTIVEMLGAIPIPGNKKAMRNFLNTIEKRINNKSSITIYPEAHIWPYYTKIRPFKAVSFKYPVKLNKPSFCITNTYQSYGKNNNKIKIVSYIDGPFFPNENLPHKEAEQNLRNTIYNCMVERSKNSNIEYIKYEKISEKVSDEIKI